MRLESRGLDVRPRVDTFDMVESYLLAVEHLDDLATLILRSGQSRSLDVVHWRQADLMAGKSALALPPRIATR